MPAQQCFALVDCNNFYVSCERLFRPDLQHQPVAVLSNNDGCIIARSQEVKKLGIKMAVPLHQVEALIKRHRVQLFSSNYALYADISARVMSVLAEYTPAIEVYSIDESFLDLTGIGDPNPVQYGQRIKKIVGRHTGIPVCVGIGPTKTLAKLANFAAKKWPQTGGVVDLTCPLRRHKLMCRVPIKEIWGIGSRTSKRLNQMGINTAWQLCQQPPDKIQSGFNIVIARTVMELNGVSCLTLDEIAPTKQQIVCSRSFKNRITDFSILAEALTEFCTCAAEKLRTQHSLAGSLSIFIRTNPFSAQEPQHRCSASLRLPSATQDTRQIVGHSKRLLQQIFKQGYRYQHCAVLLGDIRPATTPEQLDLFELDASLFSKDAQTLMATVDKINQRFPQSINLAACGTNKRWQYQPQRLSKHYTTNWQELPQVKCI